MHAPKLADPDAFHLFLSHVWGNGQDQMRVVKQRLLEMMPDLRVFLDVDEPDLQIGHLERYIERSSAVLVFCSAGYAESKNCVRELRHAVRTTKPLVALMEREARRGGVTPQQMREQLLMAEGRFGRWGFGDERPSGAEMADALFEEPCVEWVRLACFQDVTLRLIAQRLLHETPGSQRVYVQGELNRRATGYFRIKPPRPNGEEEDNLVFVSAHNPGAAELLDELQESLRMANDFRCTSESELLRSCECMLLYLDARTWAAGDASAMLASEVEEAMRQGKRLVLAHEMPGLEGDPARDVRHECEFDLFFEHEQTPPELLAAGIYNELAVPLKGGPYREASLVLLANKVVLPAGGGRGQRLARWAAVHFRQARHALNSLFLRVGLSRYSEPSRKSGLLDSRRSRAKTAEAAEDSRLTLSNKRSDKRSGRTVTFGSAWERGSQESPKGVRKQPSSESIGRERTEQSTELSVVTHAL